MYSILRGDFQDGVELLFLSSLHVTTPEYLLHHFTTHDGLRADIFFGAHPKAATPIRGVAEWR